MTPLMKVRLSIYFSAVWNRKKLEAVAGVPSGRNNESRKYYWQLRLSSWKISVVINEVMSPQCQVFVINVQRQNL